MIKASMPFVLLLAFGTGAHAELVRCTSKDGQSSVIRKDKCDSPDDTRTPVKAQAGTRAPNPGTAAAAGGDEAMAAYVAGEFKRAKELFEPRAEKGDPLAQIMMSDLYKYGRGVRPDNNMAYKWARKAADQGDAKGQALVAACMQTGTGTPKDEAGAIAWLEKSANQNYSVAQMGMAAVYFDGRGTSRDEAKAMPWVAKAAANGEVKAQALLGAAYREGKPRGWPKDEEKAAMWLRKAAAQGDMNSAAALKQMGR